MRIKIISTDFDGTLLNKNKKLTEKTRDGLRKLKSQGYIIIGVTERILETIKKDLEVELFDYIIFNSGVNIYIPKTNTVESNGYIEKETGTKIIEVLKENKDNIAFATYNKYYNFPNYPSNTKEKFIKKIETINEIEESISKITINIETQEKLNNYREKLEEIKNINYYTAQDSFSKNQKLIILPKNINKKEALENLAKKLNVKMNEIIYFGDSLNDLELIESKCITVAMGNALNIIKQKADFITLTNNEDGVITFIDKYIKGEENGTK